jgi:hypothetical protein
MGKYTNDDLVQMFVKSGEPQPPLIEELMNRVINRPFNIMRRLISDDLPQILTRKNMTKFSLSS